MVQASVWYDTCPVCQGRGAIPCKACSGIGHIRDAGHGRSGHRAPGIAKALARHPTGPQLRCTVTVRTAEVQVRCPARRVMGTG